MSAEGTWKVTMNTPMGAQAGTLTLKLDGDLLSGTMDGAQGSENFEGGKVDGDSATWTVSVKQPMAMDLKFSAKIDGDTISGDVDLGSFGSASFTGSRG